MANKNETHPLVGSWNLVSYEMRMANDQVVHPFGENCKGCLFADAKGVLSAQLMRTDRPKFTSDDIMGGTSEEMAEAFKSYLGLWGRYKIDEENKKITYVNEGCHFPNWVGLENVRFYAFENNQMTLKTPVMVINGVEAEGVFIWERVA